MEITTESDGCLICGGPCPPGRATCSEDCHKKLVDNLEREFGRYKKVTDMTTGISYRIPTREIIERGLRQQNLRRYPR